MPSTVTESRDRFTDFEANPVKQVATEPLSTFSIDVDTASYSFVRRSLMENVLPPKDAVRVEEMVNYFPYDYAGPTDRAEPFKANVSLMPTPWNADTKLMHIGIKGFSLDGQAKPALQPRLPDRHLGLDGGAGQAAAARQLLPPAARHAVGRTTPWRSSPMPAAPGTVLEPTKASEKGKILAALDAPVGRRLDRGRRGHPPGLSPGRAELRQGGRQPRHPRHRRRLQRRHHRPARTRRTSSSAKRETGIYLSVLGFGQGNYNDAMMQALAQNGNGNAAYIDTPQRGPQGAGGRGDRRRSSPSPRT